MVSASGLRADVQSLINSNGEAIRFRYFDITFNAGSYDDFTSLAQSGNDFWTSGLFQPIGTIRSSSEALLVEQGKLLDNDSKLYVDGTIDTSGTFRIGIGSANPPDLEYSVVDNGVIEWRVDGEIVYKKLFIRVLNTGSLEGEEN